MLEAKNRRNNAGHVDLERQVSALCGIRTPALLAACIVHRNSPLCSLHEHNKCHRGNGADQHHNRGRRRHLASVYKLCRSRYRRGQAGHNAGQNNHGDTVTDTALGDLFTQPHQEHRSGHEGYTGRNQEVRARIHNKAGLTLQPRGRRYGLETRQRDGAPACVIRDLTAALFTLFPKLLKVWHNVTCHLHDDR